MRTRTMFLSLAVASMLAGLCASAPAGSITYQDLINAGTSGTNFTLGNGVVINVYDAGMTTTASGTVVSPAASAISVSVSSITAGGTFYGGLQFAAGFGALGSGSSLDNLFTFDVKVVSAGIKIADLHAFADLGTLGTGSATLQETVRQLDNAPPTTIFNATLTPTNTTVNESLGGAYSAISISKDLLLSAPATGDAATVSQIQQFLSFNGAVPEPSSIALLGIGVSGLILFRRVFRKTKST